MRERCSKITRRASDKSRGLMPWLAASVSGPSQNFAVARALDVYMRRLVAVEADEVEAVRTGDALDRRALVIVGAEGGDPPRVAAMHIER